MSEIVIAIDGPAGSGKSSVSKQAARRLGYAYLDTGAAYRALAWDLLDRGVDTDDAEAVTGALAGFDYSISIDPDDYWVRVGDVDVTEAIREPRVSGVVSQVARVPEVRSTVTALFHRIIAEAPNDGIIVEGRDITTVVAPDAQTRILLTAAEEVRMARRSAELTGESTARVAEQLQKRDRADSAVVDFMTAADGVTTVDSTDIGFDETIDRVIGVIRGDAA
ncbi:(d)CMP kinase [Mycetocola reblochoni]|uniref:Cytidylate kinase n=2 Tax=Mycetocola reblochoni TaxID=331618 RepID=A0A1R4J034_9MICO|nr:(d)CMP kinase [Mycetocola reblochoni]RLP68798.1 (d)CMP kinase [Mycetocola reblochoni]SJN25278.1 Cytidylate kinase [Mycetocola reblochoni REB411]